MAIASVLIWSVCASTTGKANTFSCQHFAPSVCKPSEPTNSHHHQEARQEPSQFHNAIRAAVHEVIVLLGFAAYPVGYGGEHVGGYDEEGEVGFEEGGAEDDKEEADGEDLGGEVNRRSSELERSYGIQMTRR